MIADGEISLSRAMELPTYSGIALRVMAMSEVEREAVLAERLEAISQATFRAEVGRRTRQAQGGDSDDDDDVKRSSRNRKAVGTTSERAKTLDKLKAKRQEKGKKKGKQASQALDGTST